MFSRLLMVLLGLVLLFGCAKPPEIELREARSLVAHAYAAGASRLAAGEYQLASSALQRAEQLVVAGKFRLAKQALGVAQRYADQALELTKASKAEYQEELKRQRLKQIAAEQARRKQEERAEQARREREEKPAKVIRPEATKKKPTAPVVKPKPEPEMVLVDSVVVAAGEDLAMISQRPEVYDDKLLWPLIYKANRDQIKDPKEIFSGQVLLIPRDKNAEEVAAARQEALDLDLF